MLATRLHRTATVRPTGAFASRRSDFDIYLFVTMLVMIGFGVVAIWSAVGLPPVLSDNQGTRQAALGVVGIGIMFVVAVIDYRYFMSLAWIVYAAGIAGLALVLTPLGTTLGGGQSWFALGGIYLQPSEFAKIGTLLALATFVAARGEEMRDFGNFIVAGVIVAVPAGFVLIEPDLGQTMVYVAMWVAVMLVARTRPAYLVMLVLGALPAAWFAWNYVLQPYQRNRLIVSYHPEIDPLGTGYQIIQARISIGAGGWRGAGLAGGTQSQLNLLSVRDSDFIFAHASGMFGFIGMVGLLVAMVIFLWRCLRVAEEAKDTFGQCLAIGITGIFFFQSFLNIGMNVGIMPVTGITLPFVSYGVSSLWSFLVLAGILQGILLHRRKLAFSPGR